MSLSSIIKSHCPTCEAVAIEVNRIDFGDCKLITLKCGHCITESGLAATDYQSIQSADGKRLMPFQIDGVKFAESSNARCLIADEQGLGKTTTVCALLKLHINELAPACYVTKTTIKLQSMWELIRWTGSKKIQVIHTGKEIAIPGMDFYVCTYDALKNEKMFDFVELRTLVLDECQAIKNHLSGRAKAVQRIGKNCEHVIALSGTPIKNNAGEYFTILNLLKPSRFPEFNKFIREDCNSYETAYGYSVGGLKNPQLFHDKTKDFIIRRVQADVLPDLFKLAEPRKFQHVDLMSGKYAEPYKKAFKELIDLMMEEQDENIMANIIRMYTKMRQITGVGKVDDCVDFVTEHLISTDRRIVVFAHHHLTVDLLERKLNEWLKDGHYPPCVVYRAGDNRETKLRQFAEGKVMIASMLASGEGFDGLQELCSDMILLERQWNPANEEQVEKRIHRIGQTKPVNFIYMIASETIDDYFTQLVEQKRAYLSQTLDNKVMEWNENSLMRELAETLVSKGKKAWSL